MGGRWARGTLWHVGCGALYVGPRRVLVDLNCELIGLIWLTLSELIKLWQRVSIHSSRFDTNIYNCSTVHEKNRAFTNDAMCTGPSLELSPDVEI